MRSDCLTTQQSQHGRTSLRPSQGLEGRTDQERVGGQGTGETDQQAGAQHPRHPQERVEVEVEGEQTLGEQPAGQLREDGGEQAGSGERELTGLLDNAAPDAVCSSPHPTVRVFILTGWRGRHISQLDEDRVMEDHGSCERDQLPQGVEHLLAAFVVRTEPRQQRGQELIGSCVSIQSGCATRFKRSPTCPSCPPVGFSPRGGNDCRLI